MSKQMDVLARRDLFEAATRLEEQADAIDRMRSEMVNPDDLSQQLLKLVAGMNEAKAAQVRAEPSRLEIAAMLKAGWLANPDIESLVDEDAKWWHEEAQKLIDAGKEMK